MATFSERIKEAMNKKSITQAQLCKMTNIPKSAMSQYINGAFCPKADRIYLIAQALDVSEAWLMGYDVSINYDLDFEFINLFNQLNKIEKQYIINNINQIINLRHSNDD